MLPLRVWHLRWKPWHKIVIVSDLQNLYEQKLIWTVFLYVGNYTAETEAAELNDSQEETRIIYLCSRNTAGTQGHLTFVIVVFWS